jgi:hypothetical protein
LTANEVLGVNMAARYAAQLFADEQQPSSLTDHEARARRDLTLLISVVRQRFQAESESAGESIAPYSHHPQQQTPQYPYRDKMHSDKLAHDTARAITDRGRAELAGFDWFATAAYLVFRDVGRARSWLESFSCFEDSVYVWNARCRFWSAAPSGSAAGPILHSGDSVQFGIIGHAVEMIAKSELPSVVSALTLSGCTLAQVCPQKIILLLTGI